VQRNIRTIISDVEMKGDVFGGLGLLPLGKADAADQRSIKT